MKFPTQNPQETLEQIRSLAENFRQTSKSQKEYIGKVYNYILDNTSYTENINLQNTEIFS